MGKLALISVIGLILFFGIANYNFTRVNNDALDKVISYHSIATARDVAKSALNYHMYQLFQNPGTRGIFTETDKYIAGGIDTVAITTVLGDSVNITITAWYNSQKYELFALVDTDASD